MVNEILRSIGFLYVRRTMCSSLTDLTNYDALLTAKVTQFKNLDSARRDHDKLKDKINSVLANIDTDSDFKMNRQQST